MRKVMICTPEPVDRHLGLLLLQPARGHIALRRYPDLAWRLLQEGHVEDVVAGVLDARNQP